MEQHYKIEEGVTGLRLILRGEWEPEFAQLMLDKGIRELECNYVRGWKAKDVSFLTQLPFLRGLRLVPVVLKDAGPINSLHSLVYLNLSGLCGGEISFANLPQLRYCYLEWWPGVKSILQCKSLERAYFYGCKVRNSEEFAELTNLQRLVISNGPLREVTHLGNLTGIDYLGLYNLRNLESLKGIENLHKLDYLDVRGCRRLRKLDELAQLPALVFCNIGDNGTFESLKPLRGMKSLKQLIFYGTTKILDGDMSVLNELPNLNYVAFANRKHYSYRCEEFRQFTASAPMMTRFPIDDHPNVEAALQSFLDEYPNLRYEK